MVAKTTVPAWLYLKQDQSYAHPAHCLCQSCVCSLSALRAGSPGVSSSLLDESVQLRHPGSLSAGRADVCWGQGTKQIVWRHLRAPLFSFLFQTPAGDARALLPSRGILWWQERSSPWQQGHRKLSATCPLAAFHPQIHVPRDEGEAGVWVLQEWAESCCSFAGASYSFM